MNRSRKIVLGLLGVVALVLVMGLALLGLGRPSASAAPANTTGSASRAAATASPELSKSDEAQLIDAAVARFAARLGVDQATLNAAFTGAVSDTLDQAVRDGKMTAQQAAEVKTAAAQQGLSGLLAGRGGGDNGSSRRGETDEAVLAAWKAAAATLGLEPAQMKQELDGKSLAAVAQARGVDVQRLRDAMLAAGKAQLDADVRGGKATKAKADDHYRGLTSWVDSLINKTPGK